MRTAMILAAVLFVGMPVRGEEAKPACPACKDTKELTCPTCKGTGFYPCDPKLCPAARGGVIGMKRCENPECKAYGGLVRCPRCKKLGYDNKCPECRGTRLVTCPDCKGKMQYWCTDCDCTGISKVKCDKCRGTGKIPCTCPDVPLTLEQQIVKLGGQIAEAEAQLAKIDGNTMYHQMIGKLKIKIAKLKQEKERLGAEKAKKDEGHKEADKE